MKLSQVLITYSMSHQPSEKGFIPNFELLWYTLSQVNVCVLTSPVVLFLNLRITAPGFPVQTAVYETFVADGHTEYYGENDFKAVAPGKYEPIFVFDTCNADQFKTDLKAHQQGKSDYQTFIDQCAQNGVEKWAVDMTKMTCTYFDKTDNEILTETIPQ